MRIIVEKPFGHSLESARALNRVIRARFAEHQIYRIDHYLGKETVQNLLVFRFANSIFEPVWNRDHIHHVQITAAESLGVEHRAGYYEEAGVVRDMFQNHLLELLALTAMEPPVAFRADAVRTEKIKVLDAIRPIPGDALDRYAVAGQYVAGVIGGMRVAGYRDEPGVALRLDHTHVSGAATADRQLAVAGGAILSALGKAHAAPGHRDRDQVSRATPPHVPARGA